MIAGSSVSRNTASCWVFEQGEHAETQHVRGCFVPGDQQSGSQLRGLTNADFAGLDPLRQIGDRVRRICWGILHFGLDQPGQVFVQPHRAFDGVLAGRVPGKPDGGVVLEHLGVLIRYAQ